MVETAIASVALDAEPPRRRRRPTRRQRGPVTYLLRFLAIAYVFFLVAWPLGLIVKSTFAEGFTSLREVFDDPATVHALRLTLNVAVISVAINLVFGVGMSLLLVRYRFFGRHALNALIDLPLAVSPIVVGLSLVLVYNNRTGWFGPTLQDAGIQVLFANPAILMATVFVSLPLVVREVVPILEEIGTEQEQAAQTLGANALQVFRRITLPAIRWAVVYGVVLSLARSLGEFGAVKIVSGNVVGKTQTATLLVEQQYQNFQKDSAYAIAFLLASISVLCIVVVGLLRPKDQR